MKPKVNNQMIELTYWNSIKNSQDEKDYQGYISKFPGGAFSDIAMRRIAQIQEAKSGGTAGWNPPTPPQPVNPPPVQRIEPGFNCSRASHAAEVAICNSNSLAQYDLTINQIYARIHERLNRRNRKRLARNQKRWLEQRNRCGHNVSCIEQAYRNRISTLRAYAGG